MARGHEAFHRHHGRSPFSWPDPKSILSDLEAPFTAQQQNTSPKTVTSVVYSTMEKTFTGAIGGYSTSSADSAPSSTPKETPSPKEKSSSPKASDSTKSSKSTASVTQSNSNSALLAQQTASSASATATSNSATFAQDGTSTGGITSGAKAGIAIGVLSVIAAVLLVVFFLVRHRKKAAEHERLHDEKSTALYNHENNAFGSGARAASTRTARTASTAPRLSLRPVTQFSPTFGPGNSGHGNGLLMGADAAAVGVSRDASSPQSSWERPMTSSSQTKENPFGNHAETVEPVNAASPATIENVTSAGDLVPANAEKAVAVAAISGAAVGGAVVGLKRGASKRGNGPEPFDFTKKNPNIGDRATASPTGTDYSMSEAPSTPMQTNSAVAIAAAGGPQNTSVHRVQMDFTPTMDDEIELRAGQLIRLLHQYDDGWALCIRLDRSQQGVAPRTCLSTRPVKPRLAPGPNGPPRGNPPPGMRVPSHAQQGRSMSPAMNMGARSQSPAGGRQGRPMTPNGGMQGRPMTPTGSQGRSMSPAGRNSPSGQQGRERRITPPGPSRMNPSPAYAPSPRDVPLPADSPAQPPQGPSPKVSPQNSVSYTPVGRKPVPGQAI